MVPCMRIDDFIVDHQTPTFMKMDVEGFELEVLRGASEALRHVRCVFLELHGDILGLQELREVINLLRSAGLSASFVVQYDRPGLACTYPVSHVENIYAGDRGTYELFFSRD